MSLDAVAASRDHQGWCRAPKRSMPASVPLTTIPLCSTVALSASDREPVSVMMCLVSALVRHVGDPTRNLPLITILLATSSNEASAKISSAPNGTVRVPAAVMSLDRRYFVFAERVWSDGKATRPGSSQGQFARVVATS